MRIADRPFDPQTGPTIDVGVCLPRISGGAPDHPAIRWAKGLLDTGCSHTSASGRFASRLRLPVFGKAIVDGATGRLSGTEVWLADLYLSYAVPRSRYSRYLQDVPLTVYFAPQFEHDILIGRDLLQFTLFSVNGPAGTFSLEWVEA